MAQKFGRSFRVTIDPKDGGEPIIVTMPFTVRFWVERMALGDLNTLSLEIYNLSEANRRRIFQDAWIPGLDPSVPKDTAPGHTVKFECGYQNLYQVFYGIIQEASSAREGTDIVTRIEAWDNKYDIAATQTYQTVESGQSLASLFKILIGQFPTLKLGAVGNYPDILQRPVALCGSTWDLLQKYSDGCAYIDNGKVYVLKDNEAIKGAVYTINDSTGLLQTPRRYDTTVSVQSLLETGIDMFSQVKVESTVGDNYNALYKVIGIRHQGIISAAVSGTATTTLTLLHPQKFKSGSFVQVPGQ